MVKEELDKKLIKVLTGIFRAVTTLTTLTSVFLFLLFIGIVLPHCSQLTASIVIGLFALYGICLIFLERSFIRDYAPDFYEEDEEEAINKPWESKEEEGEAK